MPEIEGQDEVSEQASAAIKAVRKDIQWKTGKDIQHLEKRKALGHLPQEASVSDYNGIIGYLVRRDEHRIYLYTFGSNRYFAVRGVWQDVEWLALFDGTGVMETAFPPSDIEKYLELRGFVELGTISEVLT